MGVITGPPRDPLGFTAQKKLRQAEGEVIEKAVRALLPTLPSALSRTMIRALLRAADPRVVAKIIEQLLKQLEKVPPGRRSVPEGFGPGWKHTACGSPRPDIVIEYGAMFIPSQWDDITEHCLFGQTPVIDNATVSFADYFTANPVIPANIKTIQKFGQYPVGSLMFDQYIENWKRDAPGPNPAVYSPAYDYTTRTPSEYPAALPAWLPTTFPELAPMPVGEPPGGPKKAPREVVRELPVIHPDYYEVGPRERPGVAPAPAPGPVSKPWHFPGTEPDYGPADDPAEGPDGRPVPYPGDLPTVPGPVVAGPGKQRPRYIPLDALTEAGAELEADSKGLKVNRSRHRFTGPPKGPARAYKEKKVALGGTGRIGRLYGVVTEARDVIKGFHDALPKGLQKGKTLPEMLSDIWLNWGSLDASKAAANIITNEITDAAIGRASRKGLKEWQKHLPRGLRSAPGPQFGGRYNHSVLQYHNRAASWR